MDQPPPTTTSLTETSHELIHPPHTNPNPRLARFLKPKSPPTSAPKPPHVVSNHTPPHPIHLPGWRHPNASYKNWVVSMSSKHKPTWQKAGIYTPILNSTYKITKQDHNLVTNFVKHWCPKTNTFVFKWGECSITLEDMHVLGGYSFFGDYVLASVENDSDALETLAALMRVRSELSKSSAKKVNFWNWMRTFMHVDHKYEHEGFLAYWLAMFVFPHSYDSVGKHVVPIAVNLARGRKIALAPAVLASIYRDLGIIAKKEDNDCTVWAPFQLLQVWLWERFVRLRPKLYTLRPVEPRMARWVVDEKCEALNDATLCELEWNSLGNEFQWRPYASDVNHNVVFDKFYGKMTDRDHSIDELQSYARCLRPCELVGIDCIEQYLPHRVSMQFGFDQAIPSDVKRANGNPQVAWESYSKFIDVSGLVIPSADTIPGVTASYLKCRTQNNTSVTGRAYKDKFKGKKSLKRRKIEDGSEVLRHRKKQPKQVQRKDDAKIVPDAPPGFEPSSTKQKRIRESGKSKSDTFTERHRKLNDAIDDDMPLAEAFMGQKHFELTGSDDSKKKHQCSKLTPNKNDTSSVASGTHLQSSNSNDILEKDNAGVEVDCSSDADDQVPLSKRLKEIVKRTLDTRFKSTLHSEKDTEVQEAKMDEQQGENDICITMENHVPNLTATDLNKTEEGLML